MKKNRTMRIAVLMLAISLLTCCFVGSTFAKYTSSSTATDSATVAKWEFTIGTTKITDEATFDFDLFTVANDLDAETGKVLETNDAEINDKRGENVLIAPGSGGKVTVTLTNSSEVAATYAVAYTVEEAGVPLEWSTDNTTWNTDLADVPATAIAAGANAEITVYYRWVFTTNEAGDTADTTLGKAGTAAPSITAKVTVEQVD